jgi:D-3-phosphoglycerate dehydrogenase
VIDLFRVAISRQLESYASATDVGLGRLDSTPGIEHGFLGGVAEELSADELDGYDALLMEGSRLSVTSLSEPARPAVVARFGVGYDNVDVAACTANATLVTITPDAVRRPVAVAALTLVLALSQRLLVRDRLTRGGRWAEGNDHVGVGLVGRTLGVIGLGNIGRELMRLVEPFDVRRLASDPFVPGAVAESVGAQLVDLESLLRESDFVVILCQLTEDTRHLIDAPRIELMKPSACLVNVARGAIVDQPALTRALREGRIGGAALDVFEREPVDPGDPLLALDNVILSPHSLSSTDQCLRGCGESAVRCILDVAAGRVPHNVVNPAVLDDERLQRRLAAFRGRDGGR